MRHLPLALAHVSEVFPSLTQAEPADLAGVSGFYFAVVKRSVRTASEGPSPPGSLDHTAVSAHSMAQHGAAGCSRGWRGAAGRSGAQHSGHSGAQRGAAGASCASCPLLGP